MGRSTSIADVGMSIVKLLRRELVPDTLQNPDAVGLCSPTDRGDYMVGIHLYDIRESEELRVNTMIARGTEELQYPPSYVNLYYMITVTSTGDIKFRSGEEHIRSAFHHQCEVGQSRRINSTTGTRTEDTGNLRNNT